MEATMNDVQAELEHFHKDTQYLEAHREELLERYPEQWVAVFNEEVVGASPDFDQLLDDLEGREFSVGKILVDYLTREDAVWILDFGSMICIESEVSICDMPDLWVVCVISG
jgi:hypothetical protein